MQFSGVAPASSKGASKWAVNIRQAAKAAQGMGGARRRQQQGETMDAGDVRASSEKAKSVS